MPTSPRSLALAAALVAASTAVARADTPKRVEVAPWCSRTAERVGFHLAFADGAHRTVLNLVCDLKSGSCSGARLELGRVDRGEALGALELGAIAARVHESPERVSEIAWGSHALLFDSRAGFATFDGVRSVCPRSVQKD